MLDRSTVFHIGGMLCLGVLWQTDFWGGKFDMFGPYPRKPTDPEPEDLKYNRRQQSIRLKPEPFIKCPNQHDVNVLRGE